MDGPTELLETTLADKPVDNVVLTGFMGTGKTTTGRILARMLGFQFVDTDRIIEDRHGPISDIFANRGEQAFREMEREVARELAAKQSLVVSTGGRLMVDPVNVQHLSANARVFCLVASVDEILGRVTSPNPNRAPRPMLEGANPRQRVTDLLAERSPFYARFAQIATGGVSPAAVAKEIATWVRAHPRRIVGPASSSFFLGASLLGAARRIGASEDPVLVVTTAAGAAFAPSIGPAHVVTAEADHLPEVRQISESIGQLKEASGSDSVTLVSIGDDEIHHRAATGAEQCAARMVHVPVGTAAMVDAAKRGPGYGAVIADVVTMQQADPASVQLGHLQRLLDDATTAVQAALE